MSTATTPIQWTDATWNPIRGCSRVSEGCRHCYAEQIAARFSGPGLAYEGLARRRSNGEPQWTGEIRVVDGAMLDPLSWRTPRRIFVNSMSDLFHEKVADETIDRVFAVMALATRHTFQILTKRPDRMRAYASDSFTPNRIFNTGGTMDEIMESLDGTRRSERQRLEYGAAWAKARWPLPNVWLGVSVENHDAANERIPLLLETPAAVRFLSCEPLLGPVDLRAIGNPFDPVLHCLSGGMGLDDQTPHINWVIVGGESGSCARPFDLTWARSLKTQCEWCNVAFFMKQVGAAPIEERVGDLLVWPTSPLRDSHGGDWEEWPQDLRVREFPALEPAPVR